MKTIKFSKNDINLDIKFDEERKTVWMSQEEIATLFSKSRSRVTHIIKEIQHNNPEFARICAENAQTGSDGKTYKYIVYSLDAIREIGYKINPSFTNEFVDWCKEELNKLNNQIIPIESNIIRFDNGYIELDVTIEPKENTVYLSKEQLMLLFDTTRQNIEYHLSNIYEGNELEEWATCKEILQVQIEGGREVNRPITLYNLDVILSLGYRINNKKGVEFRKWATRILGTYLYKGYVVDDKRTLVTNENYVNLINIVNSLQNEFNTFKKEKDISLPSYHVIYRGEVLDAITFIIRLVQSANKSLTIIDPYVDAVTLSALDYRKDGVYLFIITSREHKITEEIIKRFPKIKNNTLLSIDNTIHDRYIVIDDVVFYEIGPSINYLGNKFALIKKEDKDCLKDYIRGLVNKNKVTNSVPIK